MKKKLLALLLVGAMTLSLAACGNTDSEKEEKTSQKEEEPQEDENSQDLKFGVLIRTFSDTYTTTVRTYMTQYLDVNRLQ